MDHTSLTLERMTHIFGTYDQELTHQIQIASFHLLLTTLFMFFVLTEVWCYNLKTWKNKGHLTEKTTKFWSFFLVLPILVLTTRLIGLDMWYGVLGNPFPMVANLALAGFDIHPDLLTDINQPDPKLIQEGLSISLSSRANQILLSTVFGLTFSWITFKTSMTFINHTEFKKTGTTLLIISLLLMWTFGPLVFNQATWSGLTGNHSKIIQEIYIPNTRFFST
jgi:hypothetical protein